MAELNFFSEGFTPSETGDRRFRELERYVSRQSRELYIHLCRLERRLAVLEERSNASSPSEDGGLQDV